MANDVTVKIGADASQLKAGMGSVKQELDKLRKSANDGIFKSGNKLENGISRIITGVGSAQSETSALTVGMAGLASIMNAGVAGAAAFAFGQVLVNGAANAKASVTALEEAIRKTKMEMGSLSQMSAEQLGNFAVEKSGQAEAAFRQADRRELDFAQKAFGSIDWIGKSIGNLFLSSESQMVTFFDNYERLAKQAGMEANKATQQAMEQWRERSKQMADSYQETTQHEEDIERLRAQNNENEAKRLEEQARLKKELAAIDKMNISESARGQMRATAFDRSHVRTKLEEDRVTARGLDKIIAEEMKSPQQRQQERLQEAARMRAEERAIDRYTQRLQDQSQGKMSDREKNAMREAMKGDLRQNRGNKQEADIRDIKETLNKWSAKIGIK